MDYGLGLGLGLGVRVRVYIHTHTHTHNRILVIKLDEILLFAQARGLQMEEIACKCQIFLSLLSSRRKQTSGNFFPSLYKFKRKFLLKYCISIMTPSFT